MLKLDPHIHSEYSADSNSKIKDILKIAKKKELDIIGISDHDTIKGSKRAIKENHDENLLIIPSIEISSAKGHILGLGVESLIPKGLSPEETIDNIHDNGGLAIIPHPFCFYRHGLLCKEDYNNLKIDGIEVKNARFILGYCNRKAKTLSNKMNFPSIGSSDAHYVKFIGDCYTEIDCQKNIDSVLKAIKKRKVKAKGNGTSNILLGKYLFNKNIMRKY